MFLISGGLNSTINHRLIAMFLRLPQFHITETITHRFSAMKTEGSDEEKEGLEVLVTYKTSGECEMDHMGLLQITKSFLVLKQLGPTPHVQLMSLTY